ncbi:MAG: bifunctional phosphoribosylaminoimidazolecarboxamide formyltransferase/IMP cyclohydrolase [Alphaproteobacteria bacterium]|nr:bifunctional phosphoribosylaminoimidazolecarboxamide formyltransferase/IMP cyclohydrolase [Alphaproteobacteria bacterium]
MTDPRSVLIKRALISVSYKSGVEKLASALRARGVELVATQGTSDFLKDKGIECDEISDFTGLPELMEGRVKTLHPKIHGGILAKRDNDTHRQALEEHDIFPIDLVVVNLYPFVDFVRENEDEDTCLDNIDIGGVAMIRSAAKNYQHVVVATDPKDYQLILNDMDVHNGAVTQSLRKRLAANAFSLTATYDANISSWFMGHNKGDDDFPARMSLSGSLDRILQYGENPHQKAALYNTGDHAFGIVNARQIQGTPLSYNAVLDGDAGLQIVADYPEPCVAIIKHTNPCGVACADSLEDAYLRAYASDKDSAFGGCVVLNRRVDVKLARIIMKKFTVLIVAPSFEHDALTYLSEFEKLRVIATGELPEVKAPFWEKRSLSGGFLVQNHDILQVSADDIEIVTERGPTERELQDLLFAFNVSRYVTSNAIVYAKDMATVAISGGQASRIDAARSAIYKANLMGEALEEPQNLLKNSVVASDGFFPFADSLIAAADAGVTAVIQPRGSVRDEEVIAAADDRAIAMVFTKQRHFRH